MMSLLQIRSQKSWTLGRVSNLLAKVFVTGLIFAPTVVLAASDTEPREFDQDILLAVADLYGITEDQAVSRLALETEAAMTLRNIRELEIDSYAGSWFDASDMRLKVAISDVNDAIHLEFFDVDAIVVRHSLVALQDKLKKANHYLNVERNSIDSVVSSHIDYKSNTVVLGVDRLSVDSVRSGLNRKDYSESIEIIEKEARAVLSTGAFRAADGTRNATWAEDWGGTWPCSIGAPVVGGFVTAGHCGDPDDIIEEANGDPLGEVLGTTWFDSPAPDIAHVGAEAGSWPIAEVNGYSDGNFSISAEWGGIVEFPVGSTVCRYGQTSGGPNCGTLDQVNVSVYYPQYQRTTSGISTVTGTCTADGDSGGTWVAGTGQIQGTHIGGQPYNNGDTCPTVFEHVYFNPIKLSLDEYSVTMLTSHGSNDAEITNVECPDAGDSRFGLFICVVHNVDSQGEVELQWTSSNGGSSTGMRLFKTCIPPMTISVTLEATNIYGTDTKYYTFPCPPNSPN